MVSKIARPRPNATGGWRPNRHEGVSEVSFADAVLTRVLIEALSECSTEKPSASLAEKSMIVAV
jgi:hypothetical protein